MAQVITRHTIQALVALNVGSYGDIPLLTITLLTGSGWLLIDLDMTLTNAAVADNLLRGILMLDGSLIPESETMATVVAAAYHHLHAQAAIKPGAGQHIIKAQGQASLAAGMIIPIMGTLTINEPGY
jgi:hypothetical protein